MFPTMAAVKAYTTGVLVYEPEATIPGCRGCYAVGMPRSRNERQALEQERTELPEQIATYQRELDATPAENRERREMREWQIRRDKKRLAEIGARLAALPAE
jgi:hypothetical protein